MNLTLVFNWKYKWPVHYFSIWCSGKSWKILTTNQFLVSTIFSTNINISFFNLCTDLFSIIAKKVNQIRNNVVFVVAHLVFVFCCALITGHCNAFQHIFVNQKKSEFYGPHFQTMLFLGTLIYIIKKSIEDVKNSGSSESAFFFNVHRRSCSVINTVLKRRKQNKNNHH